MLLHKNRLALFPNDRLGMIVSLRYPINSTRTPLTLDIQEFWISRVILHAYF